MSNLGILAEYKNKIMRLLASDEKYRKLLSPNESECEDLDIVDVILGGEWIINGKKWTEQGHLFDHDFVDDAVTDKKVFTFVDANITNITNNMFVDFTLFIIPFTDKDLIRLSPYSSPTAQEVKEMNLFASNTYANRIDAMCERIDTLMMNQESNGLSGIGEVTPMYRNFMTTYRPNNQYYGKCLQYQIKNYNAGVYCGIN
nr:MAG TPA: hypothetical protein [Caudoviricetes sp.]